MVDSGRAYVDDDDEEEALLRAERLSRVLMAWEQQRGDVSQDYSIGADDVLEIGVLALDRPGEVTTLERSVSREGTVTLPLVGDIEAEGLTAGDLADRVADAYAGKYLRDPEVTVRVSEYRSEPVVVTGMVSTPGVYYLRQNQSSVLQILSQSGGLTTSAGGELHIIRRVDAEAEEGTNRVASGASVATPGLSSTSLVFRTAMPPADDGAASPGTNAAAIAPAAPGTNAPAGPSGAPVDDGAAPTNVTVVAMQPGQTNGAGRVVSDTNLVAAVEQTPFKAPPQIITVDLKQLLDRSDIRLNVPIYGGDIVSIPPRKQSFVYVMGYVQSPGAFELRGKKEVAALQAVAMAGGLSGSARAQNSVLIRMTRETREVIKVDLTKIARGTRPSVFMEPGDTLIVGSGFFARLGEFVRPSVGASASLSPVP